MASAGLVKKFGRLAAVDAVDLTLNSEEFIAILGPSGCGKSTFLRLLAGLEQPNAGTIHQNGVCISSPQKSLPPQLRNIGMVFQDFSLFPHLTIGQNVAFGLPETGKAAQQRVMELLELVNLADSVHKMPHQISGGEQQRVAVARALAPRPEIMLLDEPFSNLDAALRGQLRRDVMKLLRREKVCAVLVTHDQHEAFAFADRLVVFRHGKSVQSDSPRQIYRQPVNVWVASFVGDANFIKIDPESLARQPLVNLTKVQAQTLSQAASLMVRPEDVTLGQGGVKADIKQVEYLGESQLVRLKTESGVKLTARTDNEQDWKLNGTTTVQCRKWLAYNHQGELLKIGRY